MCVTHTWCQTGCLSQHVTLLVHQHISGSKLCDCVSEWCNYHCITSIGVSVRKDNPPSMQHTTRGRRYPPSPPRASSEWRSEQLGLDRQVGVFLFSLPRWVAPNTHGCDGENFVQKGPHFQIFELGREESQEYTGFFRFEPTQMI